MEQVTSQPQEKSWWRGTGPALRAQLLCNCSPEKGKRRAMATIEENVACFQCIFALILSVHHLLHSREIRFFIRMTWYQLLVYLLTAPRWDLQILKLFELKSFGKEKEKFTLLPGAVRFVEWYTQHKSFLENCAEVLVLKLCLFMASCKGIFGDDSISHL